MPRRILLCVLVLGALFLERAAYWGARSFAFVYLSRQFGTPAASMGTMFTAIGVLTALSPFLGALFAAAVPARWVALAGALGSALGYALLGLAHDQTLALAALGGIAVTTGLFRPTVLVSAGQIFTRDESTSAFFCLLYAATNVAALAMPRMTALMTAGVSERAIFGAAFGLAAIATALAAAAAVVPHVLRKTEEEAAADAPAPGTWPWIASAALIAVAVPAFAMTSLQDTFSFFPAVANETSSRLQMLYSINPLVVVPASLLLAGALAGLFYAKVRVPTAIPIGLGLVLTGLAGFVAALSPKSLPIAAAAIGLASLGEAIYSPLLMARLARGLHWRAQAAPLAAWSAASGLLGMVAAAIPRSNEIAGRIALAATAFACLVTGILAVAAFRLVERAFARE